MKEILLHSVYFGLLISILGYAIGLFLFKKTKWSILNPLLVSVVFVILILFITGVDYEHYNESASHLTYLLTPATVALAVPLYQQLRVLKENWMAVIFGILSGVLASALSVLLLSYLFRLSHVEYVTLLPKSITNAIGYGVAEELGGMPSFTVAAVTLTGIFGNVMATTFCKIFRIQSPVAIGLALGTSSHALGTARALELGETEGAMSSLSIAVAGLLTVILAPLFANFL